MQLLPHCRLRRARAGKAEVEGSAPPFLLPGSGKAVLRNSHLRNTPLGVAPVQIIPCGKAPAKSPEDLMWPCKASVPYTWCMIYV